MITEPEWLSMIRSDAQQKTLLPVTGEDWRYTDVSRLNLVTDDSEIAMDGEADGIIFTDMLDALRKHPDLLKKYLGKAFKINDRFSAFHYANIANGVLVVVPEGKTARLSSKITGSGHTIIVTGRNSELNYMEEQDGSGFVTDGVEIFAGENSTINFLSLQRCKDATIFSFKEALLEKNSRINFAAGALGSSFCRTRINSTLAGEGAASDIICAFKASEKGHLDLMVNSRHLVPHTHNNVLVKGTVTDEATAVFRGLLRIEKDAQQTDSYLAYHALLLSDNAVSNSVPSLQIEANDVKASHGATVGQVDEEQLFYLMSRGMTRSGAEQLIVDGFFESLVKNIPDQELRETFRKAVTKAAGV